VIKSRRGGLFFDGERWRRTERWRRKPRVFRFDELPDELPIRNGSTVKAVRSDLRYRLEPAHLGGGAIVAEAIFTLVGCDDGRVDYGWQCAACGHVNETRWRTCLNCETERGCG
jgi:hypothetical protein